MVITPLYGKKETKFIASTNPGSSIGLSLVRVPLLSTIAQGSDIYSQRLGRAIRVKRIMFRGQLLGAQTNSVADDPYNVVRVSVARVVPSSTFTSYTVNNALDRRFSTSAGLLEVLYDKSTVVAVNAKDSTGYVAIAKQFEFDIHCDILVEYGATAASVPINQEIVLFMCSDSSAVVNPGFSAATTWVVEYIDDA
jgi:hypothetical protein